MRFPVRNIVLPADLNGQRNGRLDRSLLANIKPNGQLHQRAAEAWDAMRRAALIDGVELSHVGSYRTYLRQRTMFRLRYSKSPTGRIPEVKRTWKGTTWYLRRGMSPSAVPGESNHGLGLAVDAALTVSGKTVPISADPDSSGPLKTGTQWLRTHAVKFGWCWEVANSADPNFEPWHLVYFAGDKKKRPSTPTIPQGGPAT